MICLLASTRFHIYEPLGRLEIHVRSWIWTCGAYLNFHKRAHRSFWFLIQLHHILAPKMFESFFGSLIPKPTSFFGRQRVSQATRAHFLLALVPCHWKSLWMLQTFLRLVFGAIRVEKRERGMAWRIHLRRMILDGEFRVLKVHEDSIFSIEAKRSFHWACFSEFSDSWIPRYLLGKEFL